MSTTSYVEVQIPSAGWAGTGTPRVGQRTCFLSDPAVTLFFPLSLAEGPGKLHPVERWKIRWQLLASLVHTWMPSQLGLWWCETFPDKHYVSRTLRVDLGHIVPLHETFHEWEKNLFLLWYNSWEQHQVHLGEWNLIRFHPTKRIFFK